jgi:putative polyhydroxyalkanoate system protein
MSRPISVDVPHQLGAAEAKRRIEQGFGRLAAEIGGSGATRVESRWEGDRMTFSFAALGQSITGRLLVMSDIVRIELDLPVFLAALASTVKGRLQRQGQLLLGKK